MRGFFKYLISILILCFIKNVLPLAVMSVDLGSEWMKVAIVSPGVPMEIVLNSDSQRKTPMSVSLRDGERMIGDSAQSIGIRFPELTFTHWMHLLGKKRNASAVTIFEKRFPYHKIVPKGDGVALVHSDDGHFTPEELLAMLLVKAKTFAENYSKQIINDAVLTVPPFFGQSERRALLRAAQMANIKVLQLMNSNTAFALNYGVFRYKDFNTTETNILFYDQGSYSTLVTIASYQLVKTKERGFTETHPQLTIRGVGYDDTLGGLEMQMRLRNHLAKLFAEQSGITYDKVVSNNRAMAKLLKEAERLKKVLSANTEHKAQVENVMNDRDLRATVARTEFEELCADLLGERLIIPIEDAIKSSGMTLDEIDNVIIVGGNTRVPKLQQKLGDYLKKDLSKSVNADEAAALGAAYNAAHLSKGFKVKTFLVKDTNLFPIVVDFSRETTDGARKTVSRTLFPQNNLIPQKKVLTFNKHTHDFDFTVNYGVPSPDKSFKSISRVTLSNVGDALSKHKDTNEEFKGIKAHFRLDESSILQLDAVEAVFEAKVEEVITEGGDDVGNMVGEAISKFGNTISKLFGRSDSEDETLNDSSKTEESIPAESTAENVTAESNDTKSSNITNETSAATNETKGEVKKEIKLKVIKEPIEWSTLILDHSVPSDDEIKESENKLKKLDDREKEQLEREKVKNTLESFILETNDKLSQNEYESAATDDEKETLTKELSNASEWLEYESDAAETAAYYERLSQLRKLTRDLFERVKEHRDRPEAISALNNMLNISEMFHLGASNVSSDDQIFTEIELNTLKKLIDDTKSWMNQSVKDQESLSKSVAPKLTVKSIAEKISALDREVKYLLNKARITPPKRKPEKDKESDDKNAPENDESSKDKVEPNVEPKDESKEEHKDKIKDKVKDKIKDDEIKGEVKDEIKDKSKDESKGKTKDESKEKFNDKSKDEAKDSNDRKSSKHTDKKVEPEKHRDSQSKDKKRDDSASEKIKKEKVSEHSPELSPSPASDKSKESSHSEL